MYVYRLFTLFFDGLARYCNIQMYIEWGLFYHSEVITFANKTA